MNTLTSEESATNSTQATNAVTGKTVVITGGSGGLGYECAKTLAAAGGWHVLIASRDDERNKQAVMRIIAETANKHVSAMRLDLASLAAVREFTRELEASALPPVHGVVCNAGVQQGTQGTRYTADGFELTFGVNHLGHFLLVNLLLARLVAPARVVFVSSDTHDPRRWMPWAAGMAAPRYMAPRELAYPSPRTENRLTAIREGTRRYSTSKLYNLLYAYELDRRLRAASRDTSAAPITINSFNPGMMPGTGLARGNGAVVDFLWDRVLPKLRSVVPGINNVEESGRALARLVTDPALAGVTGRYYEGERVVESSPDSHDRDKARELWETSAELVGLQPHETMAWINDDHRGGVGDRRRSTAAIRSRGVSSAAGETAA